MVLLSAFITALLFVVGFDSIYITLSFLRIVPVWQGILHAVTAAPLIMVLGVFAVLINKLYSKE